MDEKRPYKRTTVYIKKDFQANFAVKFLALVAAEAILAIGLFVYLSKGTMTTGYAGSEIIIARTSDYFLPAIMLSNLIVLALTAGAGIAVLLLVSHKLAGPLYRFEKSLDEICKGDLTHRFTLRQNDQIKEMGQKLNDFASRMEANVEAVQDGLNGLEKELSAVKSAARSGTAELDAAVERASKKLHDVQKTAGYFKTSGARRRPHDAG